MKPILIEARCLFRIACCALLSACGAAPASAPTTTATQILQRQASTALPTITTYRLPASKPTAIITNYQLPTLTPTPSLQSPVSASPTPDPADWKDLPIIPAVDPSLHRIYNYGQTLGNDPHAFSIFGDCQARPGEFFGAFEEQPDLLESLSPELRETVEYFQGSFNRESSTAQDGTTPGALLWTQWHRGDYGCKSDETPVACELRIHRPSFVIIQIGTHFESRNTEYLRKIILQLMDAGVVPILATKADNREKDERVNRDMAMLASEYDLPLWNFWAAVNDLPNRGLYTRSDRPLQGDIYLTDEAALIHRLTGLEALNAVWRAVAGK
jgi:hypothetical protein